MAKMTALKGVSLWLGISVLLAMSSALQNVKKENVKDTVKFSFASYYESNMVLQRAPSRANVWGYAPPTDIGASVTLNVTSGTRFLSYTAVVKTGFAADKAVWSVSLDSISEPGPFVITGVLKIYTPITLQNVLFGDVWVCSGQSNMWFQEKEMLNANEEAEESVHYPWIRLFTINLAYAPKPMYDINSSVIYMHWQPPSNATTRLFSAICYLYGKHLHQKLGVPIGLILSCWGATSIEWWSSPDALRICNASGTNNGLSSTEKIREVKRIAAEMKRTQPIPLENLKEYFGSEYWYGMIHPLLTMPIYGVLWYQGERNSWWEMDLYNCTFPTMINDWREKWYIASGGQTARHFPFGFVQLGTGPNDTEVGGYVDIRWHQTLDVGYVPNPKMINTFMAVSHDLLDPVGGIHPRDKVTVGERLGLSGLAVAYGKTGFRFQGPIPTVLTLDTGAGTLSVIYDDGKLPLIVKNSIGFEVCCNPKPVGCNKDSGIKEWTSTPLKQVDNSTVTMFIKPCQGKYIMGLRYMWRLSPCPYKMAAIYSVENDLPAGPYLYQRLIGFYPATDTDQILQRIIVLKL